MAGALGIRFRARSNWGCGRRAGTGQSRTSWVFASQGSVVASACPGRFPAENLPKLGLPSERLTLLRQPFITQLRVRLLSGR